MTAHMTSSFGPAQHTELLAPTALSSTLGAQAGVHPNVDGSAVGRPWSLAERADPWLSSTDPALADAQALHEYAYREQATWIELRLAGVL